MARVSLLFEKTAQPTGRTPMTGASLTFFFM